MKTVNFNLSKAFSIVFFAVCVAFASPAFANKEKSKKGGELPVELTYLGTVNYSPVFQLDLKNDSGETLNISLRTADGDVLYATSFSGETFSKKFQFDRNEINNMQLKLVVASKKKVQVQNFQISHSNRVIEEVVVGKL